MTDCFDPTDAITLPTPVGSGFEAWLSRVGANKMAVPLEAINGTKEAPGIAFQGNNRTGLYLYEGNIWVSIDGRTCWQLQEASPAGALTVEMTNGNAGAIAIGQPVYVSAANTVDLARANAQATTEVLGLVADVSIAASQPGNIQTDGILVASTVQWDAVKGGSGGLTAGQEYILDPDNPGQLVALSATIDAGEFIAPVGIALSTTALKIDIRRTIKQA